VGMQNLRKRSQGKTAKEVPYSRREKKGVELEILSYNLQGIKKGSWGGKPISSNIPGLTNESNTATTKRRGTQMFASTGVGRGRKSRKPLYENRTRGFARKSGLEGKEVSKSQTLSGLKRDKTDLKKNEDMTGAPVKRRFR